MIKSVQKALKILKLLSDNPSANMQLKDIAELTGIEKSTCHHLIETLCSEGYVMKVNQSGMYRLGPSTFLLTRNGKYDESLISVSHPVLKWLAVKTQMTVILAVIENYQKFIIDRIDMQNNIFEHSAHIFNDDIYRTATGRIMIAHMSDEQVREIYKKYGNPKDSDWKNITSYKELCERLKNIRKQKYVRTESHMPDGRYHIGYGKGIFCGSECVGAIGIAMSCADRSEEEKYDEKLKYLLSAAKEITHRLNSQKI